MKEFCRVLSWIVLILGLIGSFVIANTYGVITNVSTSKWSGVSTTTQRDWSLTIGIFVGAVVSVLVIFAVLGALAEILERLEPRKGTIDDIKETENITDSKDSKKSKLDEIEKSENIIESKVPEKSLGEEVDKSTVISAIVIFLLLLAGIILLLNTTL